MTGHYGNCPKLKATLTVSSNSEHMIVTPPKPTTQPSTELEKQVNLITTRCWNATTKARRLDPNPQITEIKRALEEQDKAILDYISKHYIAKSEVEKAIGEDEELGADGLRKSDGADMNQLRQQIRKELGLC
jgi:hypothetical protein